MANSFVYIFILGIILRFNIKQISGSHYRCLALLLSLQVLGPLNVQADEVYGKAGTNADRSAEVSQIPVKKMTSKPADYFTKDRMALVKELDEVMREMIWLIRSERPVANKTLFGKVFRALQQAKGIKLTEKSKQACDQYELEKITEFQYRIYEHCQKHRAPDLLAKIDWSHKSVNFQFQGQNYADILGLAASLVAPTVECQVTTDDASKLVKMDCSGFRITRADQVARFDAMTFRKGKDPLMYLKGEVLKNLLPFSELTISVPLTGKVKILEKKKVPDRDETTPEINAKIKEKNQKPKALPMVPMDPQFIPRPQDPKTQSPVKTTPAPGQVAPREDTEGPPPIPDINDPNSDLRKNSDPEVIQIKDPSYSR